MAETIGGYLKRRYRWTLAGMVGGALGALLAGSFTDYRVGAEAFAFEGACAIIWGGALLVAARTRCPRCRARLVEHLGKVIPQTLQYSFGTPARRCPRCGARFDEPNVL
jgi:hypothetical protein